jgi:hypothetical protein
MSADEVLSTSSGSVETKKCPFLAEVQTKDTVVTEASTETQEDVIKLKDERSKSCFHKIISQCTRPKGSQYYTELKFE